MHILKNDTYFVWEFANISSLGSHIKEIIYHFV